MKLALIPPTDLLAYANETDYQLMLIQELKGETYATYYRSQCADPDSFVIMDNGAAEGYKAEFEEIEDMTLEFKPDEVVIPDVIGDAYHTRTLAEDFLEQVPIADRVRTMFVAQGQTLPEFLDSIEYAQNRPGIDTIAIPRHAIKTCENALARWILTGGAWSRFGSDLKPIHFLGMNVGNRWELMPNPAVIGDDIRNAVRGVDTSMPFILAWHGHNITEVEDVPDHHTRRPDEYFNRTRHEFGEHHLQLLDDSIDQLMHWVYSR